MGFLIYRNKEKKSLVSYSVNNNLDSIFLLAAISTIPAIITYFVVKTSAYVRLYADDYCTASVLRKLGYLKSQFYWYNNWSGRYSYNLLIHFSEMFQLGSVKALPIILTILLSLSFAILLMQIFKKWSGIAVSMVIGFCLGCLMISNSPNIYQTLYWQTGSLTYLAPFIFLNLLLAIIINIQNGAKIRPIYLILIIALSVFAGGFAESYIALQITLFVLLLLIASLFFQNRNTIVALTVAIISSLVSLFVIWSAPGNKIRQSLLPTTQSFLSITAKTAEGTAQYFYSMFINQTYMIIFFLVIFLGIYFTYRFENKHPKLSSRKTIFVLTSLIFTMIISVASIYLTGIYALSEYPPTRTISMAQYPIIICSLAAGVTIGLYLKQYSSKLISSISNIVGFLIFGLMLLLINPVFVNNKSVYFKMKVYSRKWDVQMEEISLQKNMTGDSLKISIIPPVGGLSGAKSNANDWVNICMSELYNVKSIKAVEK